MSWRIRRGWRHCVPFIFRGFVKRTNATRKSNKVSNDIRSISEYQRDDVWVERAKYRMLQNGWIQQDLLSRRLLHLWHCRFWRDEIERALRSFRYSSTCWPLRANANSLCRVTNKALKHHSLRLYCCYTVLINRRILIKGNIYLSVSNIVCGWI